MTYTSSSDLSQLPALVPLSLDEWKSILTQWTTKKPLRLPSPSEQHYTASLQGKKLEKSSLPRNRVFGDTLVESFFVSPSGNILQSSIGFPRTDAPQLIGTPVKRYTSSYKNVINPSNYKTSLKSNYMNENVLILKLSKEHKRREQAQLPSIVKPINLLEYYDLSEPGFSGSNKYSTLSMASTSSSIRAVPPSTYPYVFPPRLCPILKVAGQKRHVQQHDTSLTPPGQVELSVNSNSINAMSTSTTNHPTSNPPLLSFRPAALTTNTSSNRTRITSETTTNGLFLSTEKCKSTIPNSSRQTRPSLTATTMPSIFLSAQSMPKSVQQTAKTRTQPDKSTSFKENFDYPDPFTNCPTEILNRLAQLGKFQAETVEWERKKRFTKRKPTTQGIVPGKDSP